MVTRVKARFGSSSSSATVAMVLSGGLGGGVRSPTVWAAISRGSGGAQWAGMLLLSYGGQHVNRRGLWLWQGAATMPDLVSVAPVDARGMRNFGC